METLNNQNPIEQARQIYQLEQVVCEIDQETARQIGRELLNNRYKMIGANVIRSGSLDNVDQLLWQIDHSHKYHNTLEKDPDTLIGPYYMQLNDSTFCPQGIGVWSPEKSE